MAYGIMRCEKRKRAAVHGLQLEAVRSADERRNFDASDIDWGRTDDNIRLIDCRNWNQEITRQIRAAGVNERKDSIVMLDALYTASPEWFEQHDRAEWLQFFRACLDWHVQTYGTAFSAVVHLDEATPHMAVASVPILQDESGNHLSAKLIMGNRDDYRKRQDSFWEDVGRQFGMERGELRQPGDRRRHKEVLEYKISERSAELKEADAYLIESNQSLDWFEGQIRQFDRDLRAREKELADLDRRIEQRKRDLESLPDIDRLRRVAASNPILWQRMEAEYDMAHPEDRADGRLLDYLENLELN